MASTTSERHILGLPTSWLGVLTGPIMWSLHLIASWGLITVVCAADLAGLAVGGISLVYLLILAATVVMLGATLLAGIIAYQDWRRAGGRHLLDEQAEQARPFMSFCGVLSSAIFGFAIALETYPIVALQPCVTFGPTAAQAIGLGA